MPEYFVHILNWPIEAESSEEAAKEAFVKLNKYGGRYLIFQVTDKEVCILPEPPASWENGLGLEEKFDSEEWEKER